MQEIQKNEAGEVIRARTKRFGVTIARHPYSVDGEMRWSKRFYYSKMINGQLARFPLSTVQRDAEHTAELIAAFLLDPTNTLADARKKFNPRALARPSEYSTIGELLTYHRDHMKVLDLGERTTKGYHNSLLVVVREVDAFRRGGKLESWMGKHNLEELKAPWLAKPLTILTARTGTDYQRLMVPPDIEDEEEELTQKITCDTNLRNARALFSMDAMKLYRRSDEIVVPDLSEFMSVSLFGAKKYFVLQPVSVIRKIFLAAPELKARDMNAYRAFVLCVQVGLRKTEAANFRMAWLEEEDTPVVLVHADGKFNPKHGHGRKVLIDDWVEEEIRALSAGGNYLLSGVDTERTDKVFERLNTWLRKCGVESSKPTHELRKLWFSAKVKRDGLMAAAQQGGHRDPKITTSFYASNQMPENVLPFWQEPTLIALAKMKKSA